MPAARQASIVSLNQSRPPAPPQELFTMFGRCAGSAPVPSSRVGASIHWPERSSAASVQVLVSQPLAAIHRARGATPMWLSTPSTPTMVPMVWVPWSLLSHGAGGAHTDDGSNQL